MKLSSSVSGSVLIVVSIDSRFSWVLVYFVLGYLGKRRD